MPFSLPIFSPIFFLLFSQIAVISDQQAPVGLLPDQCHLRPTGGGSTSPQGSSVAAVALDGLPLSTDLSSVASTLFALEYLESLSLTFANLTGTLASASGSRCGGRLTILDLADNRLVGSVADVSALATSCTLLGSLNLSYNIVGPSATGNAASGAGFQLQTLDLSFNKISSEIDLQWLLSISDIQHLDLAGHQLSGMIPTIPDCSALYHLDLSSNHLSGEIGTGIFSEYQNLVFLNLSSNHFSGSFPDDLSSYSSLESISMSGNNFFDEFPIEALTSMPNLRRVELAFNNLTGSLSDSLSNLVKVELLDLSLNGLSGLIPFRSSSTKNKNKQTKRT